MDKIKICYFCELWESGGIESFLDGIIGSLDQSRFSVDIIAARIGDSVFTEPLLARGVAFHSLTGRLRSPGNYRIFRNLLKERRYDIIHFNIFQGLAMRYAKIASDERVPVRIIHAHGAGLRKSPTRRVKLLLHRIGRALWLRYATKTLACSSAAAGFLFGRDADEIIKNGIETDKFAFSPESRGVLRDSLGIGDAPLIGCVGRLSSEKNQAFLLRAFAVVLESKPNARLILIGDGPDGGALRDLSKGLGISDSVIFYGSSTDVPALMSAMDLFVFPSICEGLGIVAIEAQASGLPILCSSAVPRDVAVTELAEFAELDLGAEHWAGRICDMIDRLPQRTSRAAYVRLAGFDTADSPRAVIKHYEKVSDGKEHE